MRYKSKQALLDDIEGEYVALTALLDSVPAERYLEPGVWGEGWNVRDLVAHLCEWHQLFLGWFEAGKQGRSPAVPAPGFTYREVPRLNREIQRRYMETDPDDIRRRLDASYSQVLALAQRLTPDEILKPGHFGWTRKNALVTYLGANTASHYRFAMKVLRRWLRGVRSDPTGSAAHEATDHAID